jgi:hypothetical protein
MVKVMIYREWSSFGYSNGKMHVRSMTVLKIYVVLVLIVQNDLHAIINRS